MDNEIKGVVVRVEDMMLVGCGGWVASIGLLEPSECDEGRRGSLGKVIDGRFGERKIQRFNSKR